MSALTSNRNTKNRVGWEFSFLAGADVYQGCMVAMNANGEALPASASGTVVVGMAQRPAMAGQPVPVTRGVFAFDNSSGADALSRADVGTLCYVADDQTVKKAASGAVAGVVMDVDDNGVWVKI